MARSLPHTCLLHNSFCYTRYTCLRQVLRSKPTAGASFSTITTTVTSALS